MAFCHQYESEWKNERETSWHLLMRRFWKPAQRVHVVGTVSNAETSLQLIWNERRNGHAKFIYTRILRWSVDVICYLHNRFSMIGDDCADRIKWDLSFLARNIRISEIGWHKAASLCFDSFRVNFYESFWGFVAA